MTRKRGWAVWLLLVIVVACGGSANSAADAARNEPMSPDQSAREALEALETTPEQDDELLALVGKFAIVLSKSGKSRRAFTDVLIESLLKGRVVDKVVAPARDDFAKTLRDATPEVLALFNELHGILTPKQRAQLIDGLDARFEGAREKRKARNKEMLDELDIGFVQKIEIAQAMKDELEPLRDTYDKLKVDAQAAGEAFKKDGFDATEQALFKSDLGTLYLETTIVLVATLAPELEYEQRRTLANIIRHRLSGGD